MSPFLYKQLNGFLAQCDFYMKRQEGQELSILRIGVFTSTIQAVGQPTRYVEDIIFNTNFDYPSKYCIFLDIMTRPVGNH